MPGKKRMMKKVICLLLILSCILTPGCWDQKELNDIAIVLATGIDIAPGNNIKLTLQLARPSAFGGGAQSKGGQGKQMNVWVVSQTGRTVLDAQRLLEKTVSREIYWSHNVVLVAGEQLARKGIRDYINFFSRSPSSRETIWTFVSKGKAEKLLISHSLLETTSAQALGNMTRSAVGVSVMLKDLKVMLASKGGNPVLPRVELSKTGYPQGPGMEEPKPKSKSIPVKPHVDPSLTGTGVFKDDRLVGWLDLSETRGLLWLRDQMEEGVITVPSTRNPEKQISVKIIRSKTRVEPFSDGQRIWFEVKIELQAELLEQQSSEDITRMPVFKEIEKKVARAVKERAYVTLEKAQDEYGVDIFNFGQAFHRKYKNQWKAVEDRWDEVFSGVDVNITVDATIKRTGLETKKASKQ